MRIAVDHPHLYQSGILCALALSFSVSSALASGIDKKVSDVCLTSTDAAFRAKYCTAAKDYKKGYTANRSSAVIWGGVSTVCGLACGKVGVGGMTCKISSMAGSAGEGVLTKKFTDALTGEGMKLAGELGTKAAAKTADVTAPVEETKMDSEACTVAGTSAIKSYGKLSDAKLNEKSIADLRDQTQGMNAQASGTAPVFTGGAGPGIDTAGGASLTVSAATRASEICGDAALKSAKGAIRCATSVDPTLPGYVKTEEFLKDIQKATGKSADEFFSGFESPAKSLLEAPGISGLGSAQQNAVAESLAMIDKYSDMKAAGKTPGAKGDSYRAAGGSGKPSAAEEAEFDVNAAMANAFGQLNGEAIGAKTGNDESASGTLRTNRKPSASMSPEDRTISIFDRVEWRYHAVSVRDHLGVEK